jgi:hypothetical protein
MSPSPGPGSGRPRNPGPGGSPTPPPDINLNTSMNNGPQQDSANPGGTANNKPPEFVKKCRDLLRNVDFEENPQGLNVRAFLKHLQRKETVNPDGFILERPLLRRTLFRVKYEATTRDGGRDKFTKNADTSPAARLTKATWGLAGLGVATVPLGVLAASTFAIPFPVAAFSTGLAMYAISQVGKFIDQNRKAKFTSVFDFGLKREAAELALAPETLLLAALSSYHAIKSLPVYARFFETGTFDRTNYAYDTMLKPCLTAMVHTLDNWTILSNRGLSELEREAVRKQYDQLLKPAIDDLPRLAKAYQRGIHYPSQLQKTLGWIGSGLTVIYGLSSIMSMLR